MTGQISELVETAAALLPRCRREDGQDMIEYALLGALISVVAVLIIVAIGPFLDNFFQQVVNAFTQT